MEYVVDESRRAAAPERSPAMTSSRKPREGEPAPDLREALVSLSCEIRSHLNAVLGPADLLAEKVGTADRALVAMIIGGAERAIAVLERSLLIVGASPATRSAPAGEGLCAPATPLEILIADDSDTSRTVVLRMVRALGQKADVVSDGAQAVEAARKGGYDLILMDVHMPVMDGIEATKRIRVGQHGEEPYIVALTASAFGEDRAACLRAGMDDFLTKPLRRNDLSFLLGRIGTPPPAAVDPQRIAALRDTISNHDAFVDIIDTYLGEAPSFLKTMRSALADARSTDLARAAHSLKGSSLMLGANALSEFASRIQDLARADALERIPALLDELELEFGRVETVLTEASGNEQDID